MATLKRLLFAPMLVMALFLAACSTSTDDLAKEVQANIEEQLGGQGIHIKSFILTHRGGNEYRGILETREPYGEFTYSVDVIFDGKNYTWEIIN